MFTPHNSAENQALSNGVVGKWRMGAAAVASVVAMGLPGLAAAQTPTERYHAERAECQRISNAESRQACLREAGAALQASRNNQLTTPSAAEKQANALQRCDRLPEERRALCLALHKSDETRVRGSVEGGGVFRELRIVEKGEPIPVSEYERMRAREQMGTTPSPSAPGQTTPGQPVTR